jgi:hypothetical protein
MVAYLAALALLGLGLFWAWRIRVVRRAMVQLPDQDQKVVTRILSDVYFLVALHLVAAALMVLVGRGASTSLLRWTVVLLIFLAVGMLLMFAVGAKSRAEARHDPRIGAVLKGLPPDQA